MDRWRKIMREAVINFSGLDQFVTLQVDDETGGPALANVCEQIRHLPVLIVNGALELEHIYIQSPVLFEAVDEMQTMTRCDMKLRYLVASLARNDE